MALRFLVSLVAVVALLPLGSAHVSADDGPSRLLSATGRLRPAETIERAVGAAAGRAIVFVGGYGGTDPHYWDRLKAAFPDEAKLDLSAVPGYDPRGSLDANALLLAHEVRRHVRDDDLEQVALVGVSMGGAIIARSGLTTGDNVRTETMLGSPVNGSTTALYVRAGARVASALGARRELALIVRPLGAGLDDPAMRNLADRRRYAPPPGISVTQFWSVADPLVTHADATIPGREVVTLGPIAANPHGGHAVDARYVPAVVHAIRGEDPAIDPQESGLARLLTPAADRLHLAALLLVTAAFVSFADALRATSLVPVWDLARRAAEGVRAWAS